MADKPYKLTIKFIQETNGEYDNRTLTEEVSDDPTIHILKTQIFADELSKAMNQITQRLTNAALEQLAAGGGNLIKPPK